MSIHISEVRAATLAEWDAIWLTSPHATYFHSSEWALTWHHYTGGRLLPDPRRIEFSDRKIALLPLSYIRTHKGLTRHYVSSPAGTYGGWISTDTLGPAHRQLLVDYLMSQFDALDWRMNPFEPVGMDVTPLPARESRTHVLDLSPGFEAICSLWNNGSRTLSKVKKAIRNGIRVIEASSIDQWRYYHSHLYFHSLQRWGENTSTTYNIDVFEHFFKLRSPNIRLWLAIIDTAPIAGAICFYSMHYVNYWHGASLSNYYHLRPVNLLMHDIIKHACENNYKIFDFNPSDELDGVTRFKKSFGAIPLSTSIISKETRKTKLFNTIQDHYMKLLHFFVSSDSRSIKAQYSK